VRDPCGRLEWRHGAAEVEPWCRSRAAGSPHGAVDVRSALSFSTDDGASLHQIPCLLHSM
jgi:hypothetical protein